MAANKSLAPRQGRQTGTRTERERDVGCGSRPYGSILCDSEDAVTEKILVTAALPYANGPLHLGHLAGAYIPADVYVRYQKLKGSDVIYICGSDEHGVPITIRADQERVSPQVVV